MKVSSSLITGLSLAAAAATVFAQEQILLSKEDAANVAGTGEKHGYQSDTARLLRTVVNSLYQDQDVWVRELLSNSNDALEKTRLLSLTDSSLLSTAPDLNVTILADKEGSRIVIRDSGIGMSKDALVKNLGTLARSGTSDFLEKLEKGDGGNLIGQFGLGFYSSFLVADRVTVASKSNDDPIQHIFESESNAESFSIGVDPRGNTLGRGTEITLWLKSDAQEYLDPEKLRSLINRHAEYGSSPIYLWTETTTEEPIIDESESTPNADEDAEVKVEDADKKIEYRSVTKGEWVKVNDRAPLWMREPKEVSDDQYEDFYKGTFKAPEAPLAWTHFKGDAGSTSFRSLIYLPASMPNDFYSKDYVTLESLKLFVRRVFITNDLGDNFLPKYLNWIKIFVDADDLPLNVGRDSLQKSRALNQIKNNLIKRTLDLFASLSSKEPEKFNELYEKAGVALKLGAVEDTKNRARIVKLLRFETSASANLTSLDDVVSRRKKGQTQIFFMAGAGQKKETLEKSPFVERLIARGYEVLYMGEPMDEMLISSLSTYEGLKFQDVAKKGLKFGDEDEDEDRKEEEANLKSSFEPLAAYLKKQLADHINEVVISTRLTTSPCLVVTDGWTANMERLMAAQNSGGPDNFMTKFMKTQKKTFEINPHHPLISGMLEKVDEFDGDEDASDPELNETISILWQTAMVRSGFEVPDPNVYFSQVEALLRRSLGISKSAKVDDSGIKPAPPVETGPVRSEPAFDPSAFEAAGGGADWANWADMKDELRSKGDEGAPSHDEL